MKQSVGITSVPGHRDAGMRKEFHDIGDDGDADGEEVESTKVEAQKQTEEKVEEKSGRIHRRRRACRHAGAHAWQRAAQERAQQRARTAASPTPPT